VDRRHVQSLMLSAWGCCAACGCVGPV
jgi:hypothetical protein